MAKQEEMILCKGHKSSYLNCSGNKRESEFYSSWSPFSNGKVPYCKQCCEKMIQYYLKENGTMKSALWYTLMKLDIPFIKEIYEKLNDRANEAIKNDKKSPITLGVYINELQKSTTKKEIWNDFSATNVDISDIDSKIETREVKQREIDQFVLDWGFRKDINDYHFLEYTFDELTDGIVFKGKAHEMLYRDLCLARLDKRDIESGNKKEGDISKVQTQILNLMAKLKIDKFEEIKDKTEFDLLLERQIWEIENKEPCEVIDIEKYKDICNIENNWGKHILRAIRNLIAKTKDYPNIEKEF